MQFLVGFCPGAEGWKAAAACSLLMSQMAIATGDDASIPAAATRIYSDQVPDWIFAVPTELNVCGNSKLAAFGRGYWFRMVDLATGRALSSPAAPNGGTHAVFSSSCNAFLSDGKLWQSNLTKAPSSPLQSVMRSLPQNITLRASPDGKQIAYFTSGVYYVARPEGRILHVGESAPLREIDLGEPITGAEWLPNSTQIVALLHNPETGLSKIVKLEVATGVVQVLAGHLDGAASPSSIGVSGDGKTVYLSLVGTTAPVDRDRHKPYAKRDLDIFAFDLTRHSFTRVVASPFDDFSPTVVNGVLYWTTGDAHTDAVVLPSTGGRVHSIADGGQIPYWSHDGRAVAYTVGSERMADPAINYDVDMISLDTDMQPAGAPQRLITGSHEDFTPAWSPDGKWLHFHSHRCTSYVPYYLNKACTDGIWLLRAGDAVENARLISPPGTWEVGMADWSRDGKHIAFSSWNRKGPLDIAELWVITFDPGSGKVIGTENLGVPKPMVSARLQYWSPKSDELAIEDFSSDSTHIIWTLDYNTRKVHKVLEFPSATFSGLAWSADGRSIVYSGLINGQQQLLQVPKDGGPVKQISFEQFGTLILPTVSPDGKWVAATRVVTTRELWRAPLDKLSDLHH